MKIIVRTEKDDIKTRKAIARRAFYLSQKLLVPIHIECDFGQVKIKEKVLPWETLEEIEENIHIVR